MIAETCVCAALFDLAGKLFLFLHVHSCPVGCYLHVRWFANCSEALHGFLLSPGVYITSSDKFDVLPDLLMCLIIGAC